MTKSKAVSETIADYSVTKTNLQTPLVVERDGEPLAVLISIEEYRRLQSLAAHEKERQQMAWRQLDEFLNRVYGRPTSYSPAQIEAEITVAREEVKAGAMREGRLP